MSTELLQAWERHDGPKKGEFVSQLPLALAVELLNQINAAYGPAVSGTGKGKNLCGPRLPSGGKDRRR